MVSVKYIFVVLACVLLSPFSAVVEETGDLQITCRPGIRIYIDDQAAGITTEQNIELLVRGISPGIHKVRGENAEFIPSEFEVSIRAGETKQIKIGRDGAPMVLIPAGEFQMGSNDHYSAKPVHTVYLDAFYIDKYEVTNALYKKFMDATGHKVPTEFRKILINLRYNAPNQPVVGVTWDDAKAYAEWAGKRLPTEAEWEKAARGGLVGKKYPWGDEEPDAGGTYRANYGSGNDAADGYAYTAPVGSFPPNGYGLYDMAGNVSEWCLDWYDKNYYANLPSPTSNPAGPGSGTWRVSRGGSCGDLPNFLRAAYRNFLVPMVRGYNLGFRCVADAQ